MLTEVVDQDLGEVGHDEARSDTDHAGRAELGGELAGHVDERGLGEVVDAEPAAVGAQSSDRRDVDDGARAFLERLLPRCLAPQQRRFQVDLERLVVASLVDVERAAVVRIGGGVVDEDVEAAEAFDRGAHRPLAGVGIAGIGCEDLHVAGHLRPRRFELFLLSTVDHHLGARGGQRRCDRLANALRGTSDQCDLAVQ